MINKQNRPVFPHRAVITAGMPYGNKTLHFGHIGGVFIHADIFARFLRDRIGEKNVIFLSGTDCYGSAIELGFEKAKKEGFAGEIIDYVKDNNKKQADILKAYKISLNIFEGSAIGESGKIHTFFSQRIFEKLYSNHLLNVEQTSQFYDQKKNMFLNGRQVVGRCPISGCKSEIAYADECALGHQYDPSELINPKSLISGETPMMKPVNNWFFNLQKYKSIIESALNKWEAESCSRSLLTRVIKEFLEPPSLYIKKDYFDLLNSIKNLPNYKTYQNNNKSSFQMIFNNLDDRKKAVDILKAYGIRCRTSKTLVPLRLSGNISWGIPIPEHENLNGLTFWVWPESLWAPISFTKAYLDRINSELSWEDWWKSDDSKVFQFIGEDNIYFYGIASIALFSAIDKDINLPTIIPNHHLLYGKKKASSSGSLQMPTAMSLLNYYTPEQLRIHFMNANLGDKAVNFISTRISENTNSFDPVLYEGNLLTNVFNRLVRSAFYTLQKTKINTFPLPASYSPHIIEKCNDLILEYENLMYNFKFDKVFELLNIFLKDANKEWSAKSKSSNESDMFKLLMDTFHVIRTCMVLIHPIAPEGCEQIRSYLCIDDRVWNWKYIFKPLEYFIVENHRFKELKPKFDFFPKHPSQFR